MVHTPFFSLSGSFSHLWYFDAIWVSPITLPRIVSQSRRKWLTHSPTNSPHSDENVNGSFASIGQIFSDTGQCAKEWTMEWTHCALAHYKWRDRSAQLWFSFVQLIRLFRGNFTINDGKETPYTRRGLCFGMKMSDKRVKTVLSLQARGRGCVCRWDRRHARRPISQNSRLCIRIPFNLQYKFPRIIV